MKNVTCWFQGNGGLIQFGWKPRDLAEVCCEDIQVIHDLSRFKGAKNCAVISAADLIVESDKSKAHLYTIEDLTLKNIRIEGKCMCPMRIFVQSKVRKIKILGFTVETWDHSGDHCALQNFGKSDELTQHFKQLDGVFLELADVSVGGEPLTGGNAASLLRFDSVFEGNWSIAHRDSRAVDSGGQSCCVL